LSGTIVPRSENEMKALTVIPLTASSAKLDDIDEPPASEGPVLVATLAVGICGTDAEIVSGAYGWAPEGRQRLVLGHESVGRVLEAPQGSGFSAGDLVVAIVRRPDPVPCYSCAAGEWDFCRNGQYREHGIKQLDGFAREHYRADPDGLVHVDASLGSLGVLLEPTTIVAKAWEQVERIGGRARWQPTRAVVTGAGPIGLLAAMIGRQRGLEVHVIDQVTSGRKPDLVAQIGAKYHTGELHDACEAPDVIMECTGVPSLVLDAMEHVGPGGVVCLTGVSSTGRSIELDAGALNRTMVLENEAVVGSVNANRRHYQQGAKALAAADPSWLAGLVTRKVPLEQFGEALTHHPDDVKVVLEISS
jgi:threonine dehydrogenase-like Zn-dependent dehydrogenase